MPDGPIAATPLAPAPPFPPYPQYAPFPPYPPYPPIVLQCSHGHCGCGGHQGGQAMPAGVPPTYAAPPSYPLPPSLAQPGQPVQPPPPAFGGADTHTATPVGPTPGVSLPGLVGFNPLDPLGSLAGLFGSLFGGKR